MAAGLVDSLCLSVAWTILILQVTATYGLATAGMCSAAMLVGVALSAPAASWMARRLDGRRLLRSAAVVEAVLRLGVFLLLFSQAPVWLLALSVSAMNVAAWTGYAGMRAEVAAASHGAAALTWYGTIVAAVEAAGVAVAALLPATTGPGANTVLLVVMTAYVLALLPTALVAGGSTVPRAPARQVAPTTRRPTPSAPAFIGALLMFSASAPTLLAVALAAQMHGRSSVGLAAIAFTLGSLAAPTLADRIQTRQENTPTAWILCGAGMLAGWTLAPLHVALLCLAQALSGLFMTTLEGLLDATIARRNRDQVTGALARATAGRALGSAAGTALLPLVVAGVGLHVSVSVITATLLVVGAISGLNLATRRTKRELPTGPDTAAAVASAPVFPANPSPNPLALTLPREQRVS
ncbi:MAG: hypothetical protein M3211_10150 [Actinomycetota bacterium]|nr:hypothetical protein [Actinomycetota bacterium]